MSVESAADRASFLSADEFAVHGRYTAPAGGEPIGPFTAVYDRGQAKERFVAKDMRAVTAERSIWLSSDDVAIAVRGATIEIGHLDDDEILVVEETLEIAGEPLLDETGCFWLAELVLVD